MNVHRQATLLALDACQLALQQQKEEEEEARRKGRRGGGREGGREWKATLSWMVESLKKRDRLLKVYQLVIDMTPEAVTEGGREEGREGEQVFASLTSSSSSPSSLPSFAREEAAWAWLCPKVEEEEGMEDVLVEEYTHPLSVPAFLWACREGGREDEEEDDGEEEDKSDGKEGKGRKMEKRRVTLPPSPPLLGNSHTTLSEKPHPHQEAAAAAAAAATAAATKDRAVALRFVFRPLLHDVFALPAMDEVIACLGWSPMQAIVAFGEWYLSLPPTLAARLAEKGGGREGVREVEEGRRCRRLWQGGWVRGLRKGRRREGGREGGGEG